VLLQPEIEILGAVAGGARFQLPDGPSHSKNDNRKHPELQACDMFSKITTLVTFLPGDSDHGSYAPLDILIGGGPTGHTDSHRRMPVPLRSPTPASPIVLDTCDDPTRVLCAAERDQHLV
jgi:hypothetical protein